MLASEHDLLLKGKAGRWYPAAGEKCSDCEASDSRAGLLGGLCHVFLSEAAEHGFSDSSQCLFGRHSKFGTPWRLNFPW